MFVFKAAVVGAGVMGGEIAQVIFFAVIARDGVSASIHHNVDDSHRVLLSLFVSARERRGFPRSRHRDGLRPRA